MEKIQKLLKLRSKIIDEVYKKRWEEIWFFPQYKEVRGVKGFLGTAPIMFVSINPSFGMYPSRADIFYYRNLKKQGFGNAHLTDVYKAKRRNVDVRDLFNNKKLLEEAKHYLAEEIKIIQPKLIVGIGKSYQQQYEGIFKKYRIPLGFIPHYAPQFANQRTKKRFRSALRSIKKQFKH